VSGSQDWLRDAGLRSRSEHEFGQQTSWENPEPLEFMQRLAALVPRPRLHLIRFHGVLAPNAKLRSEIIPSAPEPSTGPSSDDAHAQGAPAAHESGQAGSNGSSASTLN
jgi:hypothetical protein